MDELLKDWELTNYTITMTHYNMIINGELPLPESINKSTMNRITHIVHSILNSENNLSNIDESTEKGRDIMTFEGYTGKKTRHFYNNICNTNNVVYLEIGTYYGSSSISAVYKNNLTDSLFIDNWSQFGGNSDIFKDNIEKYIGTSKYSFIEGDCWKVDLSEIKPRFNIYLFDGAHTEMDHFNALDYYLPVLQNQFIFLVDDFNWANVRDGTMRAIRELNLKIIFRHEIFMSPDDVKGMPNHIGRLTWWNGIGCFLLQKPDTV